MTHFKVKKITLWQTEKVQKDHARATHGRRRNQSTQRGCAQSDSSSRRMIHFGFWYLNGQDKEQFKHHEKCTAKDRNSYKKALDYVI